MSVWYPQNVSLAHTKDFRYQWKHWCFGFELYCRWFAWRYCVDFQNNQYRSRGYPYCMALYTHCLLARKAAAFENIELNSLSEEGLSMVKLENVREVLFQALLLDNVKFEDGKMYAELCTVLLI